MKEYFEEKRKKKASYLYYGLAASAMTTLTVTAGILSAVRGESVQIIASSFAAAAVWCFTAVLSFYIFYDANRAAFKSDGLDNDNTRT